MGKESNWFMSYRVVSQTYGLDKIYTKDYVFIPMISMQYLLNRVLYLHLDLAQSFEGQQ